MFQKIGAACGRLWEKVKGGAKSAALSVGVAVTAAVATVAPVGDALAQATYAADAATQITGLTAQFDVVYEAAFTVMLGIVIALVVWKYAKKLGSKV